MKVYGVVYLLIDGTNDREYVGKTVRSVKRRFKQHAKADTYIGKAIRAHGAENFVIVTLKECANKEDLDYWEKYFIKSRNTMAPNGYNFTEGGEGTVGCHPSDKTRAKMSAAVSGENNPFFGKHHTDESLAKMSESHRGNTAWVGRHHRKTSKFKMSESRRADSPFKNLLAEMDKRQMTYKNLANLLGMARMTLPPKMRGITDFKATEVIKLVEFFDKPAEYLFARDDGIPFSMSKNSPYKNLLIEMDKRNMTYRELAKLLGFNNDSTISAKMSGKDRFTARDIAKLEEIFGLPAEYLLARDDGVPAILSAAEKSAKRSEERRAYSPYKNLLNEMHKRQMTYKDLAELLGIKRPTLSFKMLGKVRFNAREFAMLEEIFELPAEYLLARDDEVPAILSAAAAAP